MTTGAPGPSIGFSYGGRDPALLEAVLPLVDVIEVNPDELTVPHGDGVRLDPDVRAQLAAIAGDATVTAHGVSLSIGTVEACSDTYLGLLDELFTDVDVAWHSEHLGYTRADGRALGNFLDLPRTDEALDLVAGRAAAIGARYGRPFLLENVARLLPDPGGPRPFAAFLDEVAAASGCGVLLDVHNLQCDEANVGLDVDGALAAVDPRHVGEIHVSAGRWERGWRMDVHAGLVDDDTVALAARALRRAPGTTVVFELIPPAVALVGADAVVDQLARLRAALPATVAGGS